MRAPSLKFRARDLIQAGSSSPPYHDVQVRSFTCILLSLGVKFSMRNRWNVLAFTMLGLVFGGMALYLVFHPMRTGVVPNYRMAATNWWEGWKIYAGSGTHGFLYFPTFIMLFTPFNLIRPHVLGEILWRLFGFSLLAVALWRLASLIRQKYGSDRAFLAMVLLAVPASLASINNGQTNLPLSACLALSVLALCEERWWTASIFLTVCVILKPIALAPFLLTFVAFPQARRPLVACFAAFALLGIAHVNMGYALQRWQKCLVKIFFAYHPENLRVSDLFGMLQKFGIVIPDLAQSLVRASAALGALGFVFWSHRRGRLEGAWALWVASVMIFTIFNPRVETNSYVLASPLIAFISAGHLLNPKGNKWVGWILAFSCIGLMCDGMGKTIYLATDVWLKPLIVLVVSPLLFQVPDSWKTRS